MAVSFWKALSKPIVGLSPMDGVTDYPFRSIQAKYGRPDLIYTEFVSAEGLCHSAAPLLRALLYDDSQRPVVAQMFGKTPPSFRTAAVLICELGFDGIDLNMGCPAKTVAQHGSGAALIQTPQLAQAIIKQTKQGVDDYQQGKRIKDCLEFSADFKAEISHLRHRRLLPVPSADSQPIPVSVKTRVGYNQPVIDSWIPALLETEPAAIALHGRTLKQQYSGQADWQLIGQAAQLVKKTSTLILGNGDVTSRADAIAKAKLYQLDGALLGRAALGNPFVFEPNYTELNPEQAGQLPQIALEQAQLYEQTFSGHSKYSFLPMRKHLGWYIKGLPQAKQIRAELMKTNSSQEVAEVFNRHSLI